ncbi:RNA polymerase sigma-54 factor, partial [Rhodovulum sulfidophilum]|nr:RNA polymerase sigma-54 factor [Rhodovulum sulfidophilum]
EAQRNPFLRVRQPATAAPIPESAALPPDLHAWLGSQIRMAMADPEDRALAFRLLEALEPSGWLGQPVSEIAAAAEVEEEEALVILERLQALEPAGLFARSLAECLALQLEDLGLLTWELRTMLDHLPLLAEGRIADLARRCDCEPER